MEFSKPYQKFLKKLKICQKWFRVHTLEPFSADTRSLQVRTLSPKRLVTLPRRHTSFEPIRTVGSLIRSKSLTYPKIPQKKLKICPKWFGVHTLEHFAADTRSLQVKTLSIRNGHPFQGGTLHLSQFGQLIKSKCLAYTKISQKTENLSKMVPGALFETFCSRYQIVSSKDTFL